MIAHRAGTYTPALGQRCVDCNVELVEPDGAEYGTWPEGPLVETRPRPGTASYTRKLKAVRTVPAAAQTCLEVA